MYEIMIDSEQFSGKRLVQQHRLVTDVGHCSFTMVEMLLNRCLFTIGTRTRGEDSARVDHKNWKPGFQVMDSETPQTLDLLCLCQRSMVTTGTDSFMLTDHTYRGYMSYVQR